MPFPASSAMTESMYGRVQPPCVKPSRRSSSGCAGPCITPSSVTKFQTTMRTSRPARALVRRVVERQVGHLFAGRADPAHEHGDDDDQTNGHHDDPRQDAN